MEKLFSVHPSITPFETFSISHLITVALLAAVDVLILVYFVKKGTDSSIRKFSCFLAVTLILMELAGQAWMIWHGAWSAGSSLPLNLCRMGVFVTALMLVSRNYFLYEVSYFWSLGGALNALITPTLSVYNFPHFNYLKFFISHNCLILAVLFMTLVFKFRPVWRSLLRVLGVTHIYILFVAVVDHFVKANYLYLWENPGKKTLLSFFGPWPEYLLPLWLMGIVFFVLLYLPFALIDFLLSRKRKERDPA